MKDTLTSTHETKPATSVLATMILENAQEINSDTRFLVLYTLISDIDDSVELTDEQEAKLCKEIDKIAAAKELGDMVAKTRSLLEVIKLYGPGILGSDLSRDIQLETLGRKSIKEINLPDEFCKALIKVGIHNLKELCHKQEWEILDIPTIGRVNLRVIKENLAEHGLAFNMNWAYYVQKRISESGR